MRRKSKQTKPVDRTLPKADMSNFVPPEIVKSTRRSREDLALIRTIQHELVDSGAISSEVAMSDGATQSLEELISILKEANEAAQSERDFNPEYYDESITKELEDREANFEYDIENPLHKEDDESDIGFDNLDDITYDRESTTSQEGYFPHDLSHSVAEQAVNHAVRVRLPDGTEVVGEIV